MSSPVESTKSMPVTNGKLDAALHLNRMEAQILDGTGVAQVHGLLRDEALWRRLDAAAQLRWAQLAQMAEDPATARRVLAHLNREHPEYLPAWEHHLDLMAIIGSRKALSTVLARARPHMEKGDYARWLRRLRHWTAEEDGRKDLAAAGEPFERLHHHRAAIERFLGLFSGRADCFARQWANRAEERQGYVPERRAMGPSDVQAHLDGTKTYGIYLLQADGRIRTAVIDADLNKNLRNRRIDAATRRSVRSETTHLVSRIRELAGEREAFPLVEFSGAKGYHFWFFFEKPVRPAPVRAALGRLVDRLTPDLTAFSLEVFPKQDRLGGKGFGNLVKLPLGLHRLTGKRSHFPACRDRRPSAQLDFLSTIRYSSADRLAAGEMEAAPARVVPHPRWKQWAESYPSLYRLQSACAPLALVIGACLDRKRLSLREEKILYQTIGFLPEGRTLLHYLLRALPDYNRHMVDYRLSRLRGTPLGCRRIHNLLDYAGPICRFEDSGDYRHPLLHLDEWRARAVSRAEKADDLSSALRGLRTAMVQVERFLK